MSKKHLIMEKSLELFAENGFESTSVQQITERCGISKGAFYLYFKSKDELIESLIDYFMSTIITDIEQSVSDEKETDQLLYTYINVSFKRFQKQADFTKLFLKEQVFSFNKDLFDRLHMYMTMLNKIAFSIIQRQFSNTNPDLFLDILFSVNGLMKGYSELFFIDQYSIDLDLLCKGIVEKVTLIAENSTIPIISPDYLNKANISTMVSKEQVTQLLDEAMEEVSHNTIVFDSLSLLKNNLEEQMLSNTIIQGLLKNIQTQRHCRWVAYMYQLYLNENEWSPR